MKTILGISLMLILISCGKSTAEESDLSKETSVTTYDTLAIDSFSPGATTIDIARNIRISSQKYQDSLRDQRVQVEKEKLLKKEADEKLKAEKLLEEAKKKAEQEKTKSPNPEVSAT